MKRAMLAVGVCVAIAGAAALLVGLVRTTVPAAFSLELEPVDLQPGTDHHESPQPAPLVTVAGVSGWVRGFEIALIDAAGRPVAHDVLHHVKLLVPDSRELFSHDMRHVAAAGSETTPVLLPSFLGHRVEPGDSLLLTAMLHNPTPHAWKGVRVRMRVLYSPARSWMRPLDIEPFFIHVTEPGASSHYDLPPGRSSRSWNVRPAIAGRILGVGGHIHRYGTALRMTDLTTGETLWDARIQLDSAGYVTRVPRAYFLARGGLRVRPGRVYRVTAEYDNPTADTLREAGMGTVAGIFNPDAGARWPAVDRSHEVYRRRALDERVGRLAGVSRASHAQHDVRAHRH